jgi:hypothetical protein
LADSDQISENLWRIVMLIQQILKGGGGKFEKKKVKAVRLIFAFFETQYLFEKILKNLVHTKIRTWVSAATMRHTYHYTMWTSMVLQK